MQLRALAAAQKAREYRALQTLRDAERVSLFREASGVRPPNDRNVIYKWLDHFGGI